MSHIQPNIHLPKRYVKRYIATLDQTGTNAPVVKILVNEIGNIVWTYYITGEYIGTLANGFTWQFSPVGNTTTVITQNNGTAQGKVIAQNTNDTVTIYSYNTSLVPTNGIVTTCTLEISVYYNVDDN